MVFHAEEVFKMVGYLHMKLLLIPFDCSSGPWHGPYTEINWLSETSLVISYVAEKL